MQTISQILAQELNCKQEYIENVIALLDEGSTIPFIARYRKEQHGSMDDTILRKLEDRLQYLRNLDKRRQEVKSAIEGQGKLTEALTTAIDNAATLAEVEDLYRPYKQKRRTRATVAREKGLEPLAQLLLAQEKDCPAPEAAAQAYIDPEKGVETAADALQGANDIIAEIISDDADIRKALRGLLMRQGRLRSLAATEEDAAALLGQNRERFSLENLQVVCGSAPEACAGLPAPTHTFIGGSAGNMREIVALLLARNPRVRIVATAVSLESVAELTDCLTAFPLAETEVVSLQAARGRKAGSYHLMSGQNPIYIFTMQGGGETA